MPIARTLHIPGMDVVGICGTIGQSTGIGGTAYVADGFLHCPDITQEALDAAVAAYDHDAHLREAELRSKTDQINAQASHKILNSAPFHTQINAVSDYLSFVAEKMGIDEDSDKRAVRARELRSGIEKVRQWAQAEKAKLRNT